MHASALARMKLTERTEIYLSRLLRGLAFSLVGVFIPAYLVTIGFSISTAIIFLIIHYFSFALFAPITAKIAHKYGLKKTILISPFFGIGFLLALQALETQPELLIPTAITGGLASMLFWIPMHAHFARNTGKKHVAEDTGNLVAVTELSRVVGPVTGGLVITYFGFGSLYTVGVLLLLAGVLPLFMSRDYLVPLKKNWNATFTKENVEYTFIFAVKGIFDISAAMIFPFYVFLQTTNFETTGFIAAAMGLGMMLSAIVSGKVTDKVGKHKMMRASAIICCIVWVTATLAKDDMALYMLSLLIGLSTVLLTVTVFGIFCNKIRNKTKELAEHMVYREIGLNIGRVGVFVAMLAFPGIMFELAFGLAALSSLYFAFTRF